MKLHSLLSHVGYVRLRGNAGTEITGITCDSREVTPGCLFVCMPGFRRDGHEFAGEALSRGAAALVMEEGNPVSGVMEKQPEKYGALVLVASARKAFSPLAAAFYGYPLRSLVSAAVTGTKGKTTTAWMLCAALRKAGHKTGLIGTNGAFLEDKRLELSHTTPEAHELQRLLREMKDAGCTHVVMEVSSQGFKMERVAELHFTCGIFTNLSPDHIGPGEHESFEEYLYQKSRLFSACDTGIINRDDPWAGEITKNAACRLVGYGMEQGDYRASDPALYKDSKMLGCEYRLEKRADSGEEASSRIFLPLPGTYNIRNSLAAIAAADVLGVPPEVSAEALKEVHVPGRMEVVSGDSHLWLIVDYAHNGASMESLLSTLKEYEPRRLFCVFGCGGNRSRLRRFGMGRAAGTWADISVITADNSRYEPLSSIMEDIESGFAGTEGQYVMIPDRREAIGYAVRHGKPGDIIAVIGKGHEEYQEINGVRTRFSDREEIASALRKYR